MARKLRLTKKSAIFFGIALVILSGALGYLIWRVNQPDTTAPTDSEAGNCSYYSSSPLFGLPAGWYNCYNTDGCFEENSDGSCAISAYKCDSCTPVGEPNDGDGKEYTSTGECQIDADKANAKEDPNFLKNKNACPITGVKWECKAKPPTEETYILRSNPCTPEGGTGTEPTLDCGEDSVQIPTFNKPPTQIGPFTQDGTVVLYYKSLLDAGYTPIITFTGPNGQSYPITIPTSSDGRARVVTTIKVKADETITLVSSNDNRDQGSPECAPTTNNPKYMSLGWIAPSGGECGSGLIGPPTNGTQTLMDKVSITSDLSWAQGFGNPIVSQQCWADWMEWPGDYDFNDYFLMVGLIPDEIIVETNPDWDITKTATSLCLEDNTENAQSQLTYTITVENTGDGSGTISKIEDTLDSKVQDSFVKTTTISQDGTYSDGVITWTFSTPLSIEAGATKTFTYQILVTKDSFGTYSNRVKLTPVGSDTIEAVTNIVATCTIPGVVTPTPGTNVPQTGLFDSTISRVIAGFVLLLFGGIVYNIPNITKNNFKYREKFEKKVANR
jgi:hypothetical protein